MNENNAKCPHCGAELYVGLKKGTGLCLACKKQFDVEKAIKLYRSIHAGEKTEAKKVARGSDYLEVERILDRAEFYLTRKEFDEAKRELNGALEYTNTDYRVYFGLVRAETKNLTDYRNKSHLVYLDKAIECADNEEKATITRLYKDFYRLSACSDEEIEQYRGEENQALKEKLEKKLKSIIPAYMKTSGKVKKYPIVFFSLFGVALVALVFGLIFLLEPLNYVALLAVVAGLFFLKAYSDEKKSTTQFDALLDFYDAFDGFGFTTEEYRAALDEMKACYSAFAVKNGFGAQEKSLSKLCETVSATKNEKAIDFVGKHKVLKKFLPDEEASL